MAGIYCISASWFSFKNFQKFKILLLQSMIQTSIKIIVQEPVKPFFLNTTLHENVILKKKNRPQPPSK